MGWTGRRTGQMSEIDRSQFAPHIFEVKESVFAYQPLGSPHCAFGEASSRFGVVAEIDGVAPGVQHNLVHPNHVALTKRGYFELSAGGIVNNSA